MCVIDQASVRYITASNSAFRIGVACVTDDMHALQRRQTVLRIDTYGKLDCTISSSPGNVCFSCIFLHFYPRAYIYHTSIDYRDCRVYISCDI